MKQFKVCVKSRPRGVRCCSYPFSRGSYPTNNSLEANLFYYANTNSLLFVRNTFSFMKTCQSVVKAVIIYMYCETKIEPSKTITFFQYCPGLPAAILSLAAYCGLMQFMKFGMFLYIQTCIITSFYNKIKIFILILFFWSLYDIYRALIFITSV